MTYEDREKARDLRRIRLEARALAGVSVKPARFGQGGRRLGSARLTRFADERAEGLREYFEGVA